VKAGLVTLIVAFSLGLLSVPLVVEAQQAGKVYRIGYIAASRGTLRRVFEQALRERGWVAGENIVIEYRYGEEKYDRLPALAAELVRLEPQVIVAVPTASVRAAKDATSTIPIVMWGVADPIGEGLIASFARPGGNVTGVTGATSLQTYAKNLQLLRETVPTARRIAFLRNPANQASGRVVRAVMEAARSLGVELQIADARVPEEFEPAFRAMARARADALFVYGDAAFISHLDGLAELSRRYRLPTICNDRRYAQVGGLMNYSVNYADMVRQAAGYVDRILRGATAAELPVAQPTKYELVINLKAARTLRLTIPASVLARADQVLE
jgi:putative ABC transport system substrate-binding protein